MERNFQAMLAEQGRTLQQEVGHTFPELKDDISSPTYPPKLFKAIKRSAKGPYETQAKLIVLLRVALPALTQFSFEQMTKVFEVNPISSLIPFIKNFPNTVEADHAVSAAIFLSRWFQLFSDADRLKIIRSADVFAAVIARRMQPQDRAAPAFILQLVRFFVITCRRSEMFEQLLGQIYEQGVVDYILEFFKTQPPITQLFSELGVFARHCLKKLLDAGLPKVAINSLLNPSSPNPDEEEQQAILFLLEIQKENEAAVRELMIDEAIMDCFIHRATANHSLMQLRATQYFAWYWPQHSPEMTKSFTKYPDAIYDRLILMIKSSRSTEASAVMLAEGVLAKVGNYQKISQPEILDLLVKWSMRELDWMEASTLLTLLIRLTQTFPSEVKACKGRHPDWERRIRRLADHREEAVRNGARMLSTKFEIIDQMSSSGELSKELMEDLQAGVKIEYRQADYVMIGCANCNKKGSLKKCARCHGIAYCGRECQGAHWPQHKKFCKEAK
eukprot:TRINITY_DN5403_c0_g1_i1.p1 TRINITY_DN5403_c0_g1~~TRINITY_DN5403_c0_g1_i1.p1  ORF type:complete len:502 (+),score=81.31 TRINITY_DN5403_c0_g1_i1:91-1596(+)